MTSNPDRTHTQRARRRRFGWLSVALFALATMLLPLSGYVYVAVQPAVAATAGQDWRDTNPRAETWRDVRRGDRGYTAASGPYTTTTLIQNGGQNWRQWRNGPIATYGAGLLAAIVVLLAGFLAIRGPVKLKGGFTNQVIPRWSGAARALHWYVATLFIVLALTGLSMLFGRAVLIPWLGLQGFAAYAQFAIGVHNYVGPAFVVGIVVMVLWWLKDNIPKAHDWEWFKQGGGIFKRGAHPPADHNNAGEKIFTYWIMATVGLAVCVTGLILDFPNFGQSRETMQLANIIHAVTAVVWMFFILGHIYLATIGQPGTFESMWRGYVDVNWAKQHSNLWYERNKDKVMTRPTGPQPSGSGVTTDRPASG